METLTRTMTVDAFSGPTENLQALAERLAANGIRVQTATTDRDSPSDVAVHRRNGDVLDAFAVTELLSGTDFERPLDQAQLERHSVIDELSRDVTLKAALTVPEQVRVSREFERRAVREVSGTLYAGFQHLSQLASSSRTPELYRTLAGTTDVDIYVWLPRRGTRPGSGCGHRRHRCDTRAIVVPALRWRGQSRPEGSPRLCGNPRREVRRRGLGGRLSTPPRG
jgi:hypothetical protein